MGNKKKKWFQAGAFEDGYQFGDIFKTMRATGRDVTTNLFAGAAGIAEKAIDAGAYVVGGVGGLLGADKLKDKTAKFIAKNIIDEEKVGSYIGDFVTQSGTSALIDHVVLGKDYREKYDDYSLLGEKSDRFVQSGGQLGAQIGLQAVYVPWWLTTGVTSFGDGVENALNDGATYEKAGLYGTVQMGADILSEKLFGGSGLGEKGLINVEPLTRWISNKALKTFADNGVDMLAEGAEEIFSEFMGNLGSSMYRKGNLKELLFSKEAVEGYLESFIGGVLLSGFANGAKVSKSISDSTDYRNELTRNEQRVFDQVYSKAAIEIKAKNDGNRLTKKQKAEIYDNTLQRVKSGEVDTQTIEAALGGEDYSAYKNALENYKALQQQLNEIESIDNRIKTQEQATKKVEIINRLEQTKIQVDKLKNILRNRIAEKIDSDNIHLKDRESYLWDNYIKSLPKITNNTLNDIKPIESIDENAVVEGMWEDSPNNSNNIVEKSQLESVESFDENGIIKEAKVLTFDNLTKDILRTKPPNSRVPSDWIKAGGSVAIDDNGNWIYTDWFGVSVKYINGYPDYKDAGAVVQEVNIGGFKNRGIDRRLADKLAPNGPRKKGNVWHHSQDGHTMQEVDGEIHKRFTHKGGHSLWKRKELTIWDL